ncbi:MAG: replication-associated recombination protein A [Candidatus Azobacteroides pseudotrichonymphae]|jgi:putative ATPase|nr:MAG: replication-associated recombination protein A [Candidatus Azobacteroides pseudotrichonymphae]
MAQVMNRSLAERMRPQSLNDFFGQKHLVGEGSILRRMIEGEYISSFILWGPPGVGKTTLARIISNQMNIPFFMLSAVNSGLKDIGKVIDKAKDVRFFNGVRPILFIDEIHRFSKSQQDFLLTAVEDRTIILIGATTENPSFEVIRPLLSRCQVYVLKNLQNEDLLALMHKALKEDNQLRKYRIEVAETTALLHFANGDARKLLNILELVVEVEKGRVEESSITITNSIVGNYLQENFVAYDKGKEIHYDIISAFIKSIRGSDPDAAVYWLARMIAGGEDPKFIARRLIITASEDIGLANPFALLLANACFDAVNKIGMPESRIVLAETTVYLATCPKSNSAYEAIENALEEVTRSGSLFVPSHLRNASTQLMKDLNYGNGYKYAHDYENNFVQQDFLPQEIKDKKFWFAQKNPKELRMQKQMKNLWERD